MDWLTKNILEIQQRQGVYEKHVLFQEFSLFCDISLTDTGLIIWVAISGCRHSRSFFYLASNFMNYYFSRGFLCHYVNNFVLEGCIPTTFCSSDN